MPQDIPASARPSAFGVDVLTLVTGTTIAQIITVLASPVITRLYGPETFGILALFTSITSIIAVIACMRYELAIMLPESDGEAFFDISDYYKGETKKLQCNNII